MKDRDRTMKIACRTKVAADKSIARRLRNFANKATKSAKSDYLLNKLETYKKNPKKFWRAITDILPHSKSSAVNILSEEGTQLSDKEMSETINNFFADVGAQLASKIPPINDTPIDNNDYDDVPELVFNNFRDEDVTNATKRICVYKSNGIASRIWVILYKEFTPVFAQLYNNILTLGCYPKKWKTATVIPIPKLTNATNPNDLCPISLLPLPGKLLEHLIHDPLTKHLEDNKMISEAQNGFRPKHSTTQTVFQYTSDL